MTAYAKEIPNDAVYRQESLRVSRGFEPSHLTLALASWLMRDFGSIVLVLRRAMGNRGHGRGRGRQGSSSGYSASRRLNLTIP